MPRLLILLTSSTLDKLITLGTLTLGAVSMGYDVDIYATHGGALVFLKEYADNVTYGDHVSPHVVSLVVKGMERAISEGRFFRWYDMLRQAKEMGKVRVMLCTQVFDLGGFRVSKEDLLDVVDEITDIGRFVELIEGAEQVITL